MGGWMDGWVDGWMDGWMGEWMDGGKSRLKDCSQKKNLIRDVRDHEIYNWSPNDLSDSKSV